MIHLVGLVFSGGIGIPLYINEEMFAETPVELIWAVSSAIQTFVNDSLGNIYGEKGKRSSSDLKSGQIRLITYDPFVDLKDVSKIDSYTLMALQDRYDNLELTNNKLREIHNVVVPALDRPNANIGFRLPREDRDKIEDIVLRTQELSEHVLTEIRKIIREAFKKLEGTGFVPLKISVADIDGGLVLTESGRHLVEDPAFTDLVLSNIVAENPADSKTVSIERDAPLWVNLKKGREIFTLDHIGSDSDFRLLTRICYPNTESDRFRLIEILHSLAQEIYEEITFHH